MSRTFDEMYFHRFGKRVAAYPYRLVGAGVASQSPKDVKIRQRFHQHVIIFTTVGRGRIELNEREFCASKGTVTWLDTSTRYAHYCDPESDFWGYTWMAIQGYGLDSLLDLLHGRADPLFDSVSFEETLEELTSVFQRLRERRPVSDSACSAMIARLLSLMVADRHQKKLIGDLHPDLLGQLFQTVRSEIDRPWRIRDFAGMCRISPSQLHRIFKERVGTSPMDWLRHERFHLAKQYLAESDDRIYAIAERCGYVDPYHFSRDFRRLSGLSPTQFRQAWHK